jgi:hypothetical protein
MISRKLLKIALLNVALGVGSLAYGVKDLQDLGLTCFTKNDNNVWAALKIIEPIESHYLTEFKKLQESSHFCTQRNEANVKIRDHLSKLTNLSKKIEMAFPYLNTKDTKHHLLRSLKNLTQIRQNILDQKFPRNSLVDALNGIKVFLLRTFYNNDFVIPQKGIQKSTVKNYLQTFVRDITDFTTEYLAHISTFNKLNKKCQEIEFSEKDFYKEMIHFIKNLPFEGLLFQCAENLKDDLLDDFEYRTRKEKSVPPIEEHLIRDIKNALIRHLMGQKRDDDKLSPLSEITKQSLIHELEETFLEPLHRILLSEIPEKLTEDSVGSSIDLLEKKIDETIATLGDFLKKEDPSLEGKEQIIKMARTLLDAPFGFDNMPLQIRKLMALTKVRFEPVRNLRSTTAFADTRLDTNGPKELDASQDIGINKNEIAADTEAKYKIRENSQLESAEVTDLIVSGIGKIQEALDTYKNYLNFYKYAIGNQNLLDQYNKLI